MSAITGVSFWALIFTKKRYTFVKGEEKVTKKKTYKKKTKEGKSKKIF